jgi:hypothetical protein
VRFIGSARMQIERGKERFVDQHAKQKKSSALIDDMLSYPSSCTTLGHITICSKLGDQICLDRGESALNNKQQTTNHACLVVGVEEDLAFARCILSNE